MSENASGLSIHGSIKVDNVVEIEDGGHLVCYEKMPDFFTIRLKKLNCLVIKPSEDVMRMVTDNKVPYVQAFILESAYSAGQGVQMYICFGPDVRATENHEPM